MSIKEDDRYHERGEWARHYSTIRMTVMGFIIAACAAILAGWGSAAPEITEGKRALVAVLLAVGDIVFFVFTPQTLKMVNKQREAAEDKNRAHGWTDATTLVVLGVTVVYLVYLFWPDLFSGLASVPVTVWAGLALLVAVGVGYVASSLSVGRKKKK